jgi:hypothetical protein
LSQASQGHRGGLGLLVAVYVTSRVIFYGLGVRFDATPRFGFWQILDTRWLREDLFSSLLHQHSQPPLFNLFLGLVLKPFPENPGPAFHALYLALGLALVTCLYALCERLDVRRGVSVPLIALFMVSPPAILFENWLFYTYPVAVMLLASGLFFHRFASNSRPADAVALFGVIGALALTRSSFHLLWILLCLGFVVYTKRDAWRTVAVAAAIPLLLVGGLYLKNQVLFGSFGASSWLGMNVSRITTFAVPPEKREALVDSGELSELALIAPFQDLDRYPERYQIGETTGIPALDRELKSNGWVNLNHAGYIALSRDYLVDARHVVLHHTGDYLEAVRFAFLIFFSPSSISEFLHGNQRQIQGLVDFYNRLAFGIFFRAPVFTALQMILALGLCVWVLFRPGTLDHAQRATVLFLGLNIAAVLGVSTFLELWENNRFRFATEAPVLVLNALLLSRGVDSLRRRRYAAAANTA